MTDGIILIIMAMSTPSKKNANNKAQAVLFGGSNTKSRRRSNTKSRSRSDVKNIEFNS
jgi:hypothetical protein